MRRTALVSVVVLLNTAAPAAAFIIDEETKPQAEQEPADKSEEAKEPSVDQPEEAIKPSADQLEEDKEPSPDQAEEVKEPNVDQTEEVKETGVDEPETSSPDVDQDEWGDDWGEGSDSDGFADVPEEETSAPEEAEEVLSKWSSTGFARTEWGLWVERFDDNPFAKGRQNLDLAVRYKGDMLRFVLSGHTEYDLAYLYERDSYDQPVLDVYEWLVDLRETFIAFSLDDFDITVGRQVVVWGEGDMMSLVDVVAPRDLREPGLADLDDLRLPTLATKLSLFIGFHRIESTIIHESFFGYRSPPFGPFSPMPDLLAQDVAEFLSSTPIWYRDKQDSFSLDTQQFLMRWSYKGPGIDLALYIASILDQQGIIELDYPKMLSSIVHTGKAEIILDHKRYMMVGQSGAWPFGNWLFKWELGADIKRSYNVGDADEAQPDIGVDRASTIGGMVGVTYSGFKNTMVFLEFKKSWLLDDLPDLLFSAEEPAFALRYTHMLLNNDLELELAATMFGWSADLGWLVRATINYVIRDGVQAGIGYITYQPGSEFGLISSLNNHDRISIKLRWDFTLY
ncbi:MAG: hypothetical protein GY847_35545 [Proteobacteria bacterium]|nr:hypothetical protein [Pseudomonadota bacterium]